MSRPLWVYYWVNVCVCVSGLCYHGLRWQDQCLARVQRRKRRMRRRYGCSGRTVEEIWRVRASESLHRTPKMDTQRTRKLSIITGMHTYTPTLTCNARKLMQKCNIKISLSGISWICLHGCVWIGNTWPLTRYQHNWMWIWSCVACQTKTCPLTSEPHSAAWCCTCM